MVALLERCSDVCEGTSKASSGIVHAGFDKDPGPLMAKLSERRTDCGEAKRGAAWDIIEIGINIM